MKLNTVTLSRCTIHECVRPIDAVVITTIADTNLKVPVCVCAEHARGLIDLQGSVWGLEEKIDAA